MGSSLGVVGCAPWATHLRSATASLTTSCVSGDPKHPTVGSCCSVSATDFRIVGRIEHFAPQQFLAIACALPDVGDDGVVVQYVIAHSLSEAAGERDRLVLEIGTKVRARGDRVIDVETE